MDALRTYRRPAFVYLPPGAELRGGAWVVIDSAINSDQVAYYTSTTVTCTTHPGTSPVVLRSSNKVAEMIVAYHSGIMLCADVYAQPFRENLSGWC